MSSARPDTNPPVLEVRGAIKRYGSVSALEDVSLTLGRCEILALLGDNGAGKSTLIKAISGAHQLDAGEILLAGEQVSFRGPGDARRAGIETVYQDLALFDNLSPAANFFIGRELTKPAWLGRLAFLREREMSQRWVENLERLQVNVKDLSKPVGLMSGGQRQAVAVARAVAFAERIVILDEPTAALGLRESREVLALIRRLPDHGISVVLISHNMEQVMQIADRATVLRQGRLIGSAIPSAENHHAIVSMIVGGGAQEAPPGE